MKSGPATTHISPGAVCIHRLSEGVSRWFAQFPREIRAPSVVSQFCSAMPAIIDSWYQRMEFVVTGLPQPKTLGQWSRTWSYVRSLVTLDHSHDLVAVALKLGRTHARNRQQIA